MRRGGLDRRGARVAQIVLQRHQAVDHVAERVVDDFQRVARAALGLGLAEAQIVDLALDDVDEVAIDGGDRRGGRRREGRAFLLEMAQRVGELARHQIELGEARAIALEPLQQFGDAPLQPLERLAAFLADIQAVDARGQRVNRAFQYARVAGRRVRARLQRIGQRRDPLFERGE